MTALTVGSRPSPGSMPPINCSKSSATIQPLDSRRR